MSANERDFKGVWVPKQIWLDTELGWSEKLLLVEIESLDNERGCFASNEYLGKFFGLSKDRISKMVSSLKDKGYLDVHLIYFPGTKNIEKRIISIDKLKFHGIDTYRRKQLEGIGENTDTPIGENAEDNNTVINNTVNKVLKDSSQKFSTLDMENAELLFSLILENNPDAKKPNLEKWANEFRLIRTSDKREDKTIKYLVNWCQKDSFWKSNILSPAKLRKQWDQLYLKAKQEYERANKPKQQVLNKPWEGDLYGTETNSYDNANNFEQLPKSVKQIGY